MPIPSPEISRIMTMNAPDVFLEIARALRAAITFNNRRIYGAYAEKEILITCFKSLHFRKRKPMYYDDFRDKLILIMHNDFKSENDRDKFLEEFKKMWDEWCYAWMYIKK